jgi:tRNA A-37 threonylcarbamoyl transferase component Bud32
MAKAALARSERLQSVEEGELLALVAAQPRVRICSLEYRGRKLWLKHYGVEILHPGRLLHFILTPVIYPRFMKSSSITTPAGMVRRETRKLKAFARAGLLTPELIWQRGRSLLLSDLSISVKHQLRNLDQAGERAAHEALLVQLSEALGRVHAAGLCHGRPLARDAYYHEGEVGFGDFEEEPEAVMPLAEAQARDLAIQMLETVALARDPGTPARCFAAYRRHAPQETLAALSRLIRFFERFLPLTRGYCRLSRFLFGGYEPRDFLRLERTLEFLKTALGCEGDEELPSVDLPVKQQRARAR